MTTPQETTVLKPPVGWLNRIDECLYGLNVPFSDIAAFDVLIGDLLRSWHQPTEEFFLPTPADVIAAVMKSSAFGITGEAVLSECPEVVLRALDAAGFEVKRPESRLFNETWLLDAPPSWPEDVEKIVHGSISPLLERQVGEALVRLIADWGIGGAYRIKPDAA